MRIAVVHPRLSPRDICRFADLATLCEAEGDALACIEVARYPTRVYRYSESAAHEAPFPVHTLFPAHALPDIADRVLRRALRGQLDALGPDMVITTGYASSEALYAAQWAKEVGGKVVFACCSTREGKRRSAFREKLKSAVVRCFDGAFVGGKRSLEYVVGLGLSPDACVAGIQCVDNDWFSARASELRRTASSRETDGRQAGPNILYVGRLAPEKNLERLLDAFARARAALSSTTARLTVVGAGPLHADLQRRALELGLEDTVSFEGFVLRERLPACYAGADVLVLPSLSESWGLVVNEAMASGLPVAVSSRCGCAADLVVPGETGWTFDPSDANDIEQVLTRILSAERGALSIMGKRAAAHVAQWHPERFAAAAFTFLKELRRSPARPARSAGIVLGAARRFCLRRG